MGYSCKLLLAVAEEEGEGCEARLIDLKPDQTLPPGIPHQTRVKDACPKTCNACDGTLSSYTGGLRGPFSRSSEPEEIY